MGSPWAFAFALSIVLIWGLSGPWFDFSDSWELIINTLTTIITFLMVFIIQNSQNRDMRSLHLKLDELIRVTKEARNRMVSLENMSEEELDKFADEFKNLDPDDVLILRPKTEPVDDIPDNNPQSQDRPNHKSE